MTTEMLCPKCNAECDRVEVDIGVGVQYSPWYCSNCGWSQQDELVKFLKAEWDTE